MINITHQNTINYHCYQFHVFLKTAYILIISRLNYVHKNEQNKHWQDG